jgi:hypothetical protein
VLRIWVPSSWAFPARRVAVVGNPSDDSAPQVAAVAAKAACTAEAGALHFPSERDAAADGGCAQETLGAAPQERLTRPPPGTTILGSPTSSTSPRPKRPVSHAEKILKK